MSGLHLGSGSVSARPSALNEQPFVKSCGGISLADWLELCPECPDVHLPQKTGHSWGSRSPRRLGFPGEAQPCLPLSCRVVGEGPERPRELPYRRQPAICCHWGHEIASMETEPGIVFPETSQSNLCGAGLCVWVYVCSCVVCFRHRRWGVRSGKREFA